jgi:hypothetical protein
VRHDVPPGAPAQRMTVNDSQILKACDLELFEHMTRVGERGA